MPTLPDEESPDESYEDEFAEKRYFGTNSELKKAAGGNYKDQKKRSNNYDLLEIVQNIDEISQQAENMKISRNDFINCLRDVTRQKMLDIK